MRSVLGRGSYGSVCEAMDSDQNCLVAIKRITNLFRNTVDCKRNLRELAILRRVNHPNIVRLHDVFVPLDPKKFDEIYIVMEICDSDLRNLMKLDVFLNEDHINMLLYNVLKGVKYLHSAGVYHRDLKPANIFCNQNCSVRVGDFGLARAVMSQDASDFFDQAREQAEGGGEASAVATQHVGTRWYRAPELILLTENYTEAVDTWSVGCIYWELVQMLAVPLKDRKPLFPGNSCFPLSPHAQHRKDFKFHTRSEGDMLNQIFNVIGTPTEDELKGVDRADAVRYLRLFKKREAKDIRFTLPFAPVESARWLEGVLKFNPKSRLSIPQAIEHDLLQEYRPANPAAVETTAKESILLEFEPEGDLNESRLRYFFEKEMTEFVQRKRRARG